MDSNKINNKLKTRIAISKVCEEDIVMNKEKSIFLKNLGITSMALVLTSGICFASVKLINAFGPNSSTGSQEAIQNGYVEYVKDDSLVDSFMLDNYNFYITFKEEKLGTTLDDIKNKYEANEIGQSEKEYLSIKNENDDIVFSNLNHAYSVYEEDGKIYYTATAKEFPTSKKLYINFAGIEETLEVPDYMQTELVTYTLKSISDENWKFESAALSNTAFKIYLSNCNDFSWNNEDSVETSDGKKFYKSERGDGDFSVDSDGSIKVYATFNLTKKDATNELKVHLFKSDGEEVIIELEKNKAL